MKTEKASFQLAGYKCLTCGVHTLMYNGAKPPDDCPNCGANKTLKMEWNQQIDETVVKTSLPLVD